MGSFYTNVTIYGPNREQVVAGLDGRAAAVSPTSANGFTVVYHADSESQNYDLLLQLAGDLSRNLQCPAIAILVHDDDILLYALFKSGEKADEYNSCPGYWDGGSKQPSGGNAKELCSTFGVPDARFRVKGILWSPKLLWWPYLFAIYRHRDLVRALQMPDYAVGIGWEYLRKGDLPMGLAEKDIHYNR